MSIYCCSVILKGMGKELLVVCLAYLAKKDGTKSEET